MQKIIGEGITFDDVSLVPAASKVEPRQADIRTQLTREITLNIPLLSAPMDTVTQSTMAIALGQEGGIGILHRNMSQQEQCDEVRTVKRFEAGIVLDPITIQSDATISQLRQVTEKNNISGVPVLSQQGDLVGIVTRRDVRFESNLAARVDSVMTPRERLITAKFGTSQKEILQLLHQHRIEKILIVDENGELVGLVTVKDIDKTERYPNAIKDSHGSILVGAAVGTSESDKERVEKLIAAKTDLLVVDTAHAHHVNVLKRIQWIKKNFPKVQLIGGNIVTAEAAIALKKAGVDAVKVGIGPGSICTTRIVAGVGVPQVTAIMNVAHALKGSGIPVIADGGIRHSGDIAKALAAGASAVMIGGLFAGTTEAPGALEIYQGRSYKTYRGMGSLGAMGDGGGDRYGQPHSDITKLVPEGVEGRVPYKGNISQLLLQLTGGLRSTMGYVGCSNIKQIHTAKFIRNSQASMKESHAHDVTIIKEPPNYPLY